MLGNCYFCRIGTEHRLKDEFNVVKLCESNRRLSILCRIKYAVVLLCLRLRFNILVAHDYGKTLFGVKIVMNAVNMDKEVIFLREVLLL